jgi:Zn-dependent metalloprotease
LVSSSTFSDAKKETIFVAKKLYGDYVASSVKSAWDAVGVN